MRSASVAAQDYQPLLIGSLYRYSEQPTFGGTVVSEDYRGYDYDGHNRLIEIRHYSQVEVDTPLIYTQPTTSRPDRGVKPDIEVKTTQQDIALGRDPFLEAVR